MSSRSSAVANEWCRALGIEPPNLEAVAGHREASTFALLLVALLERGEPMSLDDVAARFEEAGIAERSRALLSLSRCRPARAPVYREGERYHLDPHDEDLDLWAFRLGLRPPRVARIELAEPRIAPVPGPEVALTQSELDEAWKDASLFSWSAPRFALAVLDAHGGPLRPEDAIAAVAARTRWHRFRDESASFRRRGSAVAVLEDGRWAIAEGAADALTSARVAVRARVAVTRQRAAVRTDPAILAAYRAEWDRQRAAHGAELAGMSRALLVAFPPSRPQAAALLDVGEQQITTFVGPQLDELRSRLMAYDIVGAVDVRAVARALGIDPGELRVAELGPPQKTMKVNQSGRTLRITTALLVQGSCGIGTPFGEANKLAEYLAKGQDTKLRRRLEADVKSLYALYEYARLHGVVMLRWGFLNERIPAPWVHRDEPMLHDLKTSALAMKVPLEIVVGSAPGWAEPWSRARLAHVEKEPNGWRSWLVDEEGYVVDESEVQRARLSASLH